MEQKKYISNSAVVSYSLSIVYMVLAWATGNSKFINYSFIALHFFVIALLVFILFFLYLAISIGFMSSKMSDTDKSGVKLTMKTMPHRTILGIFYWAAPIGLYFFYLTQSKFLYFFVWLPLWYPIVYYIFERYIKGKEKRIGSPIVEQEKILEKSKPSVNPIFGGIRVTIFLLIFLFAFLFFIMFISFFNQYGNRIAAKFNPCENPDLDIESRIDCFATKSNYGIKATQSKNLALCDYLKESGEGNAWRIVSGGVVIDELFNERIRAQCRAYITNDISYCFKLNGHYWDNNSSEKGYRYHRAQCIFALSKGDINYCYNLNLQEHPQNILSRECALAVIKAQEVHDRGIKDELIIDEDWNGMLPAKYKK